MIFTIVINIVMLAKTIINFLPFGLNLITAIAVIRPNTLVIKEIIVIIIKYNEPIVEINTMTIIDIIHSIDLINSIIPIITIRKGFFCSILIF